VFYEPSEPFVAANIRQGNAVGGWLMFNLSFALLRCWPNQQLVVLTLMGSFIQVMGPVGTCNTIEMLRTEENKMVQAFVPQRAKKPLYECLAIGRTPRSSNGFGPHSGQGSIKAPREFPVPVMLDESYPHA